LGKDSRFAEVRREIKNLNKVERKDLLAKGEKASFITLICNFLLIIFKSITGIFIGSIALLASGLDALTDLVASIAVLLGLRYSQKDPSKRFPYGYYRMETLATLIVAILIILFGLDVLLESSKIIISPNELKFPLFGLFVSLISIFAAFSLYRYNLTIGTKISSNALISTAKEFQLDIFTNSLVFVGIAASIFHFPQIEGFIGFIIAFFIIKTGFGFGKNSLLTLLDALDDPEIIERIHSTISHISEVQEISNIRIRKSGPYYFVDIEIKMNAEETVKSIAGVTHKIETQLKKEIQQLDSIMISVEPIVKNELVVAITVPSVDSSVDDLPDEHFGMARAFLIAKINIPDQTIISHQLIKNPYWMVERKRGILAAEFLAKEAIDILAIKDVKTFGIGPKAVLKEKNIQLFEYKDVTVQQILENLIVIIYKKRKHNVPQKE